MKPLTDLEVLVRHLAGRERLFSPNNSGQDDSLDRSFDDPTSDASQFLDEIRRRTRSLLDEPATVDLSMLPTGVDGLLEPPSNRKPRRSTARQPAFSWITVLLLALLTLGVAGGLVRQELDRRVDQRLRQRTEQILSKLGIALANEPHPDLVVAPDQDEIPLALNRLATSLASLDTKTDALSRSVDLALPIKRVDPTIPTPLATAAIDPGVAPLAADLAAIRRELVNSESATTRQLQEMRTVLQEVNTVVRRVLSRPQASPPSNASLPILIVTVQALTNNLQHPSAQVRGEAVEQLIRIGSPARSAIPALQQRLNLETDSNVRTTIEAAINVLSSN